MKYNFQVENIKCGGCTNTITSKLKEIDGVQDVFVNIDNQQVIVISEPVVKVSIRSNLGKELARLGYPEVGTASSNSMITKATSFVSCALGKASRKH
jgi:copper chaperone